VSKDILRELNDPLRLDTLKPENLILIMDRRLENSTDGEKLREMGILNIAKGLTRATNNPWAFLRWLHYLSWHTDLDQNNYIKDLAEGYVLDYFELVYREVQEIARWFFKQNLSFVPRAELRDKLQLNDAWIDLLERHGVLIPFDVTLPKKDQYYTISPLLHFVKLLE
jgi:hypothetical protein